MRRALTFRCHGNTLHATLDEAPGDAGLLIVSGGNEIRIGAHRGMARLAADLAEQGHPVFRFDRRGVGDSEGENGGFEASADDLAAAVAAFRSERPKLKRIIAFGNCDAASALLLHLPEGLAGLFLTNIWVIEEQADAMPPPAAIKAHYWARLRDPQAWKRLLGGAVDLRKLAGGLAKVSRGSAPVTPTSLPARVAAGLDGFAGPISILLAAQDGTAAVFADAWETPLFANARAKPNIECIKRETASHSFARDDDYAALLSGLLTMLRG